MEIRLEGLTTATVPKAHDRWRVTFRKRLTFGGVLSEVFSAGYADTSMVARMTALVTNLATLGLGVPLPPPSVSGDLSTLDVLWAGNPPIVSVGTIAHKWEERFPGVEVVAITNVGIMSGQAARPAETSGELEKQIANGKAEVQAEKEAEAEEKKANPSALDKLGDVGKLALWGAIIVAAGYLLSQVTGFTKAVKGR